MAGTGTKPTERVDIEEIIINAMRFFGYSLHEAEEMTLREYSYMMHVFNLKRIDQERDLHMQAYLNHAVTSTKSIGKKQVPAYKTFKDFYDYEKEINRLLKPQKKVLRIKSLILEANTL